MPTPTSWRPAVAALVNDELREAYARVVLGEQDIAPHLRARLIQAGLITVDHGVASVHVIGLRAVLANEPGPDSPTSLQRYLTIDGAIDRYPPQKEDRLALMQYVAERVIAEGDTISVDELNTRLLPWDVDLPRLRNHLIDFGVVRVNDAGDQYSR